jgi:hypothetical protein
MATDKEELMRRTSLIAAVVSAFALGAPAGALGRAHRHHSKHHARHSHRVKSHIMRFAASNPSAPATTTPSDNAGTVASFTNGVLTLTLNDNSTVSGKVTNATEIGCTSPTPVSTDFRSRSSDGGGDGGGGDGQSGGQTSGSQTTGSQQSGGDDNGGGDDNNAGDDNDGDENGGGTQTCDSSSLVPGAVVHEAELRIDSSGATFKKVELVK